MKKYIFIITLTILLPLNALANDRDDEIFALNFESQEHIKMELITEMKYAEKSLSNCIDVIAADENDWNYLFKALSESDIEYGKGAGHRECLSGLDSNNEYEYDFYNNDDGIGFHFGWEYTGLEKAGDECSDTYKAKYGVYPEVEYYEECMNKPEIKAKYGYTFYYSN